MTVHRSPGWGNGRPAEGVYWTKARVVAALRRYAADTSGPLPVDNHDYSAIKKGRLDLPTAGRVLELWPCMARAWLAVGIERYRVPRLNTRWSRAEITFLLDHAGELPLRDIARRLDRSYAAVRTKLGAKGMGIKARENQGFLTGCRVAKEYNVPLSRVQKMLATGAMRATYNAQAHRWRIDPMDAARALGRAL